MSSDMGKKRLSEYSKNVYSQNGEDGIIEKIFAIIGTSTRVCIEFGAWDGFHLSNTANLWVNGWKGVLIEGVTSRYEELKQNVESYDCLCINAFVSRDGDNSLDAITAKADIGSDIDLLSIDIDGDDYYVFQSLNRLCPRVIICEYNPTIPAEIDLFADYGSYFGASVAALCRLAETKGYVLVAITETNCIFVQDALAPAFAQYETRLEQLKSDKQLVYLVTNYAGDYVVCGRAPYGISAPYTGKLFGPQQQFPNGAGMRGLGIRLSRALKKVIKKIFWVRK
jgi:hypothetical protein